MTTTTTLQVCRFLPSIPRALGLTMAASLSVDLLHAAEIRAGYVLDLAPRVVGDVVGVDIAPGMTNTEDIMQPIYTTTTLGAVIGVRVQEGGIMDADMIGDVMVSTASGAAKAAEISGEFKGDIIGRLMATSSSLGDVWGLHVTKTGSFDGQILGDISAIKPTHSAYGIQIENGSMPSAIGGNIMANGNQHAIGIYNSDANATNTKVNFLYQANKPNLTVTTIKGGVTGAGTAIKTDAGDISITTQAGNSMDPVKVTLQGNIDAAAGAGSINFESGNYEIASDFWNASAINFSNGGTVGTRVTVINSSNIGQMAAGKGDLTLNFDVVQATMPPMLRFEEGSQMQIAVVNVHIDRDLALQLQDHLYNVIAGDIGSWWDEDTAINIYVDGELHNEIKTEITSEGLLIGLSGDILDKDFIPEPSTAGLGLLALAGLMARRRRKDC